MGLVIVSHSYIRKPYIIDGSSDAAREIETTPTVTTHSLHMMPSPFVFVILLGIVNAVLSQQTGNHPEWPRWCGKVYESGYSSFDPGGQAVEPPRDPNGPLLYIQVAPRYSLYLDSETEGEFVVRMTLSPYFGSALPGKSLVGGDGPGHRDLHFTLRLDSGANTSKTLIQGTITFDFSDNATTRDTIVPFDLTLLKASIASQNVTLIGWIASPDSTSNATYTASTSDLLYLPETKNGGSVTRLDNAYGGFWHRPGNATAGSSKSFRPFFPYGFYSSYDGFLAGATNSTSAATVIGKYTDFGLNAMTPLSQYPQSAAAFDYMASRDLRIQFDLREQYTNLTWVAQQVTAARDNSAMFSYWSADEPDGHQDPFSAPRNARDTIRSIDPYHPVALVLNCQDYYFGAYTDGSADVIMEDVYPIGINSTWSKWGTACNTSLGDCGCDNCLGGVHAVQDVGNRLDDLARYESWLPGRWPATKIHNPQSFSGEGYWARDPTPEEEWAMALLAVNHGALGIMSWVYPVASGDALPEAHGQLARVLTISPIVDFIVGNARPIALSLSSSSPNSSAFRPAPNIDVACWRRGKSLLVSIVNSGYDNYTVSGGNVTGSSLAITIPPSVWPAADRPYHSIGFVAWGNSWAWSWAGNNLLTNGIPALSTSLIVLSA